MDATNTNVRVDKGRPLKPCLRLGANLSTAVNIFLPRVPAKECPRSLTPNAQSRQAADDASITATRLPFPHAASLAEALNDDA